MQLDELLNNHIRFLEGVTSDSRNVRSGYLFAALPGNKVKGSQFIGDAITHGASIILCEKGATIGMIIPEDVQLVEVDNSRQAFSQVVAKFYTLQPENIVSVTGTSGKTSTVSFVQQLWHLAGITKCASLGTLGVRGPGINRYGRLTTPDTENLHAEIADLTAVGITHLAMEASSHGLDQFRLDGVRMKAGAFTNLSRDHLDYHQSMDEYFMAKSRLFTEVLAKGSHAVITADDEYSDAMIDIARKAGHAIMTFGYKGHDLKIIKRTPLPQGQDIEIEVLGKKFNLTLPLVGEFQVMNALCALALVLSLDKRPDFYVPLLQDLRGVPGRLQLVSGHPKGAVYVDYAHKPAALEAVLKTLRPHTQNKLVCVFGCGGNRDSGKREIMGKIAIDLADKVIVTDDNPREEIAANIRQQIMASAKGAIEIADRAQAIKTAVCDLKEGDVLVVAGKGHEQGQIIGDTVLPFDDVEEVKKAIGEIV